MTSEEGIMPTSERARSKRRARLKERRAVEAKAEAEIKKWETYWKDELIPIDNLPDFIQDIAKRTNWEPKWNECYKNAVQLGLRLDDFGFEVQYCEAIVEQGDYEKSMGKEGKGHSFSHAWLRVNGRDINVSSNGEPLNIYRQHRMVVMPIKKMRKAEGYGADERIASKGEHYSWLGGCLSIEQARHPELKPFVFETATPEILTEYTTTEEGVFENYREKERMFLV